VAWGKELDALEAGDGAWERGESEDMIEATSVWASGDHAGGEEGFDFGGEEEPIALARPVDRADSEAIAGEKERAGGFVPEGDGKLSAEAFEHPELVFFPEVGNDFGIAGFFEVMPAFFEIAALLEMIEEFTIEDRRDTGGFVGHGLLSIGEADDAQSAGSEPEALAEKVAFFVGATMTDCRGHSPERFFGNSPLLGEIDNTCDAAHGHPLPRFAVVWRRFLLNNYEEVNLLLDSTLANSVNSTASTSSNFKFMSKESIAIIGIGCRFPGGINHPDDLWKLLVAGKEAICDVPADRWNAERYYDPEPGLAGKSVAKRGGFVEGIDQFDPQFFGISPREAAYVDPQHRLLLETAWEAIEDAGLILDFEKGTDLGVFVGISHNDYQVIQGTPWDSMGISAHSPTGSAHSIAANRISYCLNLLGPSVAMDTACSSALTAVHAACDHIRTGRGDMALAGGVTVMITPGGFIGFSQAGMLSPEGKCKAFDASANGFVRGEGAGMVLLKRLSQAIADGDPIHGVIIGTALNQDGHTNGISLPCPKAQARLVKEACLDAGISPLEIGFVEAHGTGTAVGDPIEAHALADALCGDRPVDAPLIIGSVKTNLGHLETAAGVAGLVKAILVLKHGKIPANLHFETPNPNIDFEGLKLRVNTTLEAFPETPGRRMVGVNSFGFGGANAHIILEEAPPVAHRDHAEKPMDRVWPIVLSARSEEALRGSALQLAQWIEARSHANGDSPLLPDLVYSLGARRNHHPYRLTVAPSSIAELIQELDGFGVKQESPKVRTAFSARREVAPRVALVMSGQGPQWWGMGRELMRVEPVFRETMERCAEAMKPWASFSLLEELGRTEEASQMHRTEIAQPSIFAMQVSLAALWKSWGIDPVAVVGHSVGEIAAACVAGVFSIEEGARIIVLRARFMDGCARGAGTMLAVGLGEEDARSLIARHDRTVTIAAINGPRSLTLAGAKISLEAILAELEPQGVFARMVRVDHPFHHPLMEPASLELEAALADLVPQADSIPFFSTVTGARCAGESCTPIHWGRGVRQPVLFAAAVNALAEFEVDVWLEIGAHPALVHSIQECLAGRSGKPTVVASMRREREQGSLVDTAMDLYRVGVPLDFAAMTSSRRLLGLPAYAWDKSRWWHESNDWKEGRLAPGGRGLLDIRLPRATPTWTARLDGRHMAFLKDHKVDSHVIFPAAGFVEMVLEAGVQLFEGRAFVVEDFEIRKPLILPDPASGVHLEFSYDLGERTWAIQSRFDQGAAWSLHVVGSMRCERTESPFATSTWASAAVAGTEEVEVAGFYRYMSDLGLRYGDEFRPIRELAAGGGHSSGLVALSEAIAGRASEYALHPVLFDGALQTFSAGAATIEDRRSRMKLPVRFSRILFLRSPGASVRVRAGVLQCNEEFVEGRLGLYDEEGQPCVLVDGFRAISVSGVRRSGSPGGIRDVVYHVDWERTMLPGALGALAPLPLGELRSVAAKALEQVLSIRGRKELEGAMAAGDDLAAGQLAEGLRKMGVKVGEGFTGKSLGVASAMEAVFERLMASLVKRGILENSATGWVPTLVFSSEADSAQALLRQFVLAHSGHLPEGLLCAANCAELGPILRGEKDAVQVLFSGAGADLLDQFYGDGLYTSQWLAAIAAAVQEATRTLPEGRGLRILEIGGGTAGLAAHVLPLLERNLHSYTFSDVSAGFFPGALQKLASFPEVTCQIFDLEKPGTEQEFLAESFDLIIGTNVLHAVCDVRATLANLHELLVPGGSLIFMDTATPMLWTETVFGLTSGWWRFTDRELRPDQPLLNRAQWERVLKESGFAESTSLAGLLGSTGGEGQIGLLARKAWTEIEMIPWLVEPLEEKSWLIFADAGGLGDELAARLRSTGASCQMVTIGEGFAATGPETFTVRVEVPEDWQELLLACNQTTPLERIVYLWALDASSEVEDGDTVMGTDGLLHLCQALEATNPGGKLRIDAVTRGAQPVGRETVPTSVAQSPAVGLFRVILNEYSNLACRGIDLPPFASSADIRLLWSELPRTDAEREVAFRGEARFAQRLTRGRPANEQILDSSVALRLESRERGHLDTLRFSPFVLPECGPGEVLIDVKAAGMNFRDVLKALALYPGEAPDARIFGDEVGGVIKAVGAGVKHVVPGDRVYGLAVFGLATETLARGGDVCKIPGNLSFEEAATLPVVFMTSWHALKEVARLRAGETILVHAGAGGVGMAAIQIAHYLGAEVIASAGNATKRNLLKSLGVKHVIDSRRGDFAEAVLELTDRRGVDVVLNALAAEAIPMGLSCLAEFGRFIEIGKRDIYQNSRIPLWSLRRNASFHVVAMDAVFSGDEALTRAMLTDLSDLVEKGQLGPLPFRSFPASRIDAAFRLMASGKHIGKVVVSFPEVFVPRRGEPLATPFSIQSEGTYLITGAFGGFGKVIAEWLVQCGARHLVLSSRSGANTPETQAFVQSLIDRSVSVQVVCADVGSAADVERLFGEIRGGGQPLRGLFHLAMVIDDAPLSALTRARMQSVIGPKAYGAWLLHRGTVDLDLDCFVMFSSISSIFGNPAQGNYGAANAFLDSLAYHRRALGLPALTMNWGVLGGEGYVARNERVAEFLARQGTTELSPGEVMSLMEASLVAGNTQVAAIRVDWAKWRQFFRSMQENPLLGRILASVENAEGSGATSDWRLKIEAASGEDRESIIVAAVREVVGSVLRVKPDSLRDDQPLTDLGLDSLMGVEIENSLEATTGVALPPTSLMRARTIGQIAALIASHMGSKASAGASAVSAVPAEVTVAGDVDLDALSDEEIDRLLGVDSAAAEDTDPQGVGR
jgi:acyl transferase domain-containing protein/NADPH:quinone reductase-like Zn-dependent oxidoreductase/acyl carrier protein